MYDETIELRDGIRLLPPTEDDLEHVERNLREGDAMEHSFFGGSLRVDARLPSWVVWHGDERLGVGGFTYAADGGPLSDARVIWFLSTSSVDRQKVFFVRHSREVIRAMVGALPKWVRVILATPMSDYRQSVGWLKRVCGFGVYYRTVQDDAEFTIMIARREVLENV